VRDVRKKLKHVSERRACRAVGQPRSTQRYRAQQRNGERALVERMLELALRHPRYGYRRIAVLLRAEGFELNVKRVHRLWRAEGLKVPQKQRKKRRLASGCGQNACDRRRAQHPDQVWSFDFCFDRTCDGRPLKIFSVLDEFTRRCLTIEVDRHLTGPDIVRILAKLMRLSGIVPQHLRCDNGPEFICHAVKSWLEQAKVQALYIDPGSPWENAYAESYHARLRDEVLNGNEFATLVEARALLSGWRDQYNHERPHSALDYKTPAAFAAAWAEDGREAGRAEPGSATLRPARHGQQRELIEGVAH
jgi:transposase InsO family protein